MGYYKADIITMGCSKNLVDSERLMYQFYSNGLEVYHNPKKIHGDIVVINTCGFINDAKEESIEMILSMCELRKQKKIKRLYVMGCLSQRFLTELQQEIKEVDQFYGKFNWTELLQDIRKTYIQTEQNKRILTTPKHYAYVKLSEGCNRGCAYCSIPIITGPHRSRPIEDIVEEVKYLVGIGVKEFQLIAQELTFYGMDLYKKRTLRELLLRLSDIKGVEWLRLHYGYPSNFPTDILPVMKERENICKYLDIALQHASDNVLKRMRRNITKQEQTELLQQIREEVPEICLRTTFMVGFPGETEEDFVDLLDYVKTMRFDRMGAFAYSHEEGTYAGENYQDTVSLDVKQRRLSKLMALQQDISTELCQAKVGSFQKIIVDRREGDYYIGRTQFDSPEVDGEVLIPVAEKRLLRGHFYSARIVDSEEFDLFGTIIH